MSTHVKELITQNANQLLRVWRDAPLGIYSAGLNQRDTALPIIYGGVKSIANNLEMFGRRDLMIVDEGHLISPRATSTYQKVIAHFKVLNPYFKVIMLTATPYRMGQGLLTEGGIATDICFDITGVEAFNRLIAEGYISPLVPFRKDVGLDLSSVGISANDFNQHSLQEAIDQDRITYAALEQCVTHASDRWAWLIFASGVQHSENIAAMLWRFGISAAAIHSELSHGEREARITAFKRRQLRCLVNMNVLTTGFDFPPIDFIGMLRPTLSTGLWVQMLGRGTRPYDHLTEYDRELAGYFPFTKRNCLVLDFAANARRLGPINDPKIPRKRGKGGGLAPIKDCEHCGAENHASARVCVNCSAEFTFSVKISGESGTLDLISSDGPIVEWFDVERQFAYPYITRSKGEKILKVSYHCRGGATFEEFAWFGQSRMAGRARDWWRKRHASEPPGDIEAACALISELRQPTRIRVWTNKKPYPEILSAEFNPWHASDSSHGPTLAPSLMNGSGTSFSVSI